MAKLIIQRPAPKGFALLKSRFSVDFNAWMKTYPGIRWGGEEFQKKWLIPQELHECVRDEASKRGLTPSLTFCTPTAPTCGGETPINPSLFPPQKEAVLRALRLGFLLVSSEPGCGKTAVALEVGRLANAQRILVACPASVRTHWVKEIAKWWPSASAYVNVIESRKDWDSVGLPMRFSTVTVERTSSAGVDGGPPSPLLFVTSHDLLPSEPSSWDLVILDEANAFKNRKAARTKQARQLLREAPGSIRLALTGTPLDVGPQDLFPLLDLVRPGGLGYFSQFRERYLQTELSSAGFPEIVGVNDETIDELKARIAFCSIRTTKAEIAPWLPALQVVRRDTEASREELRALPQPALAGASESEARIRALAQMRATLDARVQAVKSWMEELDEAQSEVPRCIITYHKELGERIATALVLGREQWICGETPARDRDARVLRAVSSGSRAPLAATLRSVGIGRDDLVGFKEILVAEVYPVASTVVQLLNRFHRLSSTGLPARVSLLSVGGTSDETTVEKLLERVEQSESLFGTGVGEQGIRTALSVGATPEALRGMFDVDE